MTRPKGLLSYINAGILVVVVVVVVIMENIIIEIRRSWITFEPADTIDATAPSQASGGSVKSPIQYIDSSNSNTKKEKKKKERNF